MPNAVRPAGVVQKTLSLDRAAVILLEQYAPTRKAHGRFLSRLLYEHDTRQRILGKVASALEEVGATGKGE
jgi:hypothetical protein